MNPQVWLIMGAFWLVQAIYHHASQNPGNVVTAPSVQTWLIGIPAILSIVWAVFSKRFAAADKAKLFTDFAAALSDGKITGAEIGQLLKTAGFDASILTDIAKALGGQLLGGLTTGDANATPELAFLQQRISLLLASSDLKNTVDAKGTPQEIAMAFKDGTVLSNQFLLKAPNTVDPKDAQLQAMQAQLSQLLKAKQEQPATPAAA